MVSNSIFYIKVPDLSRELLILHIFYIFNKCLTFFALYVIFITIYKGFDGECIYAEPLREATVGASRGES